MPKVLWLVCGEPGLALVLPSTALGLGHPRPRHQLTQRLRRPGAVEQAKHDVVTLLKGSDGSDPSVCGQLGFC